MLRKYQKSIAVIILVFLLLSTLGSGFVSAAANDKSTTDNALTLLGIAIVGGLTAKLIDNFTARQNYEQYLQAGKNYLAERQYDLALSQFRQAQELKDNAELNSLLAKAYLGKGKTELGINDFAAALKNFKKSAQLVDTAAAQKLLAEAEQEYQAYHYQQALDYQELNNLAAAYQELQQVVEYGDYQDAQVKLTTLRKKLRAERLKCLAVLEFADRTYDYGDLGAKMASLVTTELQSKDMIFIEVVERAELTAIINAESLSQLEGTLDPLLSQEVGDLLEIDHLVVGEILAKEVTAQTNIDYREEYDNGAGEYIEQKVSTQIRTARTEVLFKLLNLKTGKTILTETLEQKVKTKSGSGAGLLSADKLLEQSLQKNALDFVELLHEKYEL